MKIDYFFGDIR